MENPMAIIPILILVAIIYFGIFVLTISLLESNGRFVTNEQQQENLETALSWPIYIIILPLRLCKIMWKVAKREFNDLWEKS